MTKSWSSFERQKLLQESWRNFLNEEAGFGAQASRFFSSGDDAYGEKPMDTDEELHGLQSQSNEGSLINILRQQAPFLANEDAKLLISTIAQLAEDEGIMLELSLKGLNSEQDRVIDADGSAEILSVIAGFNLSSNENRALLKALNQWGRLNSIKFSKPEKPIPRALGPEDLPPPSDVEPDGQDDEKGVMSKIKDVGGKIQDVATSDAVKALEGTLDAASLIPGANLPASIASALVNLAQGEPKEAALSLLSIIPLAGVAGKLGKFGPILMKLAPAIKTFNKARGAKGAKEALQIALDKAGTGASVEDLQKASKTALDYYDKLSSLPGVGEQLQDTIGPYVEPLRGAQEFLDTPEPSGMPELVPLVPDSEDDDEEGEGMPEIEPFEPSDSAPEEVELIDLSNPEDLVRRSQDPKEPPFPPPERYAPAPEEPVVFISMLKNGNLLNDRVKRGDTDFEHLDFADGTWALYRDIEDGSTFIWSPKAAAEGQKEITLAPDMDPKNYTDLPIAESFRVRARWQELAGINKN